MVEDWSTTPQQTISLKLIPTRISSVGEHFNLMHTEENIELKSVSTYIFPLYRKVRVGVSRCCTSYDNFNYCHTNLNHFTLQQTLVLDIGNKRLRYFLVVHSKVTIMNSLCVLNRISLECIQWQCILSNTLPGWQPGGNEAKWDHFTQVDIKTGKNVSGLWLSKLVLCWLRTATENFIT